MRAFLMATSLTVVIGAVHAAEFPPEATMPTAAEISAAFQGKSFNTPSPVGTIRSDYAKEGNGVTSFIRGQSDQGTWKAEDGRICFEMRNLRSTSNDVRFVGPDIYIGRSNGDVVKTEPR